MTVNDVKRQIKANKLCPFYVFTGAEIEAQRIYINKVAEVTGKPVKRIESVKEAFNKRASILKLSNVYVCRDDAEFWKSATEISAVDELLGDNILILEMTDIDGRSKASKLYADRIITFEYMDADTLYKYVQKVCSLSDENTFDLIDLCERDYSRILLETNKVHVYARAQGVGADEAFETLVSEGAISRPPKDAIFDFTDAFLRADISRAFNLLKDCKEIGEPSLRLISVLYSNIKRVLQVQICESKDICKTTGLTAWDVKIARQTAGSWQSADLVFFLKTLQRVEQGIKTGEIDEESAIDYFLVSAL
jgi:DNA polymerase III delta subunit